MARIIYKPHCSECGAIIEARPMCEKIKLIPLEGCHPRLLDDEYTNIYPQICKSCGTYFDCIEITPPIIKE